MNDFDDLLFFCCPLIYRTIPALLSLDIDVDLWLYIQSVFVRLFFVCVSIVSVSLSDIFLSFYFLDSTLPNFYPCYLVFRSTAYDILHVFNDKFYRFFPSSYALKAKHTNLDMSNLLYRSETKKAWANCNYFNQRHSNNKDRNRIIITYNAISCDIT